jgi:hypothetical protein
MLHLDRLTDVSVAHMDPEEELGERMTLEEFKEECLHGSFDDYDGFGEYATDTEVSGIRVYPSDIVAGNIQGQYTHVVWFNRW